MTQYELIKKWREEAENMRENAKFEYNDYDVDFYLDVADTLERCANDLEAMTY